MADAVSPKEAELWREFKELRIKDGLWAAGITAETWFRRGFEAGERKERERWMAATGFPVESCKHGNEGDEDICDGCRYAWERSILAIRGGESTT